MDDDLLGHVGGSELPSLPSDDLYENKIDLTVKKAPAPTPTYSVAQSSDIPDMSHSDTSTKIETTEPLERSFTNLRIRPGCSSTAARNCRV